MQIRIENWIKNDDSQRAQVIGWAKVCIAEKMSIWMTVLSAKNGGTYCKVPSCKAGSEYVPAISWTNSTTEKELSEMIKQELQKGYLNGKQQLEMGW